MQTAVECNDSSNSSSNNNISSRSSNGSNSAESSVDSATPYLTTKHIITTIAISATTTTIPNNTTAYRNKYAEKAAAADGPEQRYNHDADADDDDDDELDVGDVIDDEEVRMLLGNGVDDDVSSGPMTFIKGTTLAEELASVLAQEMVADEQQPADIVTLTASNVAGNEPSTATTTTNHTNNSVISPNVSVRLPHNINAAEYLGTVIEQMSVTPSPTPPISPQKQQQQQQTKPTKPALMELQQLKQTPLAAAVSSLNVLPEQLSHNNSSSSNSNSNSNSNSTTSSVIATPILARNSNGLKPELHKQSDDCKGESPPIAAPAAKPLTLSVKSASIAAFDEKFLSVSAAAATAGKDYLKLTASAASSSTSSSGASSTTASIANTPSSSAVTTTATPSPQTPATNTNVIASDLLHWKDMPQYLQFNPYVLEGYRPLQTFRGCLLSLFYWHNETINILTHAIPIVYILAIVPGLMPWEKGYRFLSFCHVFGSVAPWCGSFIYHLFMNIEKGENVYYRLLKLDMVGIWVSQSFGALPLVTATSHCFTSKWKWLVIISYCLMSLWGLYKAMTASSPWQRRLCFALPFTMRSILTFLRTLGVVGGNSVALPHVYLQDVVSILGGAIGAMRIPEKWFPGLVDFYLNSHNIMHVLVVVAVYSMHKATVKDFEWMSTANCDAFTNTTSEAIENSFTSNVEL